MATSFVSCVVHLDIILVVPFSSRQEGDDPPALLLSRLNARQGAKGNYHLDIADTPASDPVRQAGARSLSISDLRDGMKVAVTLDGVTRYGVIVTIDRANKESRRAHDSE